ncbi:MAG TPA: PEP/pyruvate-binding domain-containing protein, partial [Gaiellaceae bacterium]|nr:PEP/pyruvate-binding domain-containing protein [Gaiellaceae bacterium]
EIECVADPAGRGTVVRDVPEELRARLCLEPDEVARLAELGREVERHYGSPQDVEWAIDRATGETFLLQARPETVWTPKRAAAETVSATDRIAAMYLQSGKLKL